MIRIWQIFRRTALLFFVLQAFASAASKPHIITFGKWSTVAWNAEDGLPEGEKATLKVRPLLIDARVREFTFGPAHEVTDRLFVVRRAFRVNDNLPQEAALPTHWQWQQGGWLLVDRVTGRISPINLPDFDASYSAGIWYRDYVAYCGVSEDGKKVFAVVAQIGRRKAVLKKPLEGAGKGNGEVREAPEPACPVPTWQRNPVRISFESAGGVKQTFAIRSHGTDLVAEEDEDAEGSK